MIIFGAGGHAKVILDCIEAQTYSDSSIKIEAIIDNDRAKKEFLGYPVTHNYCKDLYPDASIVIAIGENSIRKEISRKVQHKFGTVVHPSAIISSNSEVSEGTVVFHKTVVQASAHIGKHVIINTAAIVEHDCHIHDFAHIGPRATLCGQVEVGVGTLIGAGATILPGIKVGKWAKVGAGAIVTKNVPDGSVIIGNPYPKIDVDNKLNEKIYISPPHLTNQEVNGVFEVFASNWIAPGGKANLEFERKICEKTESEYALTANSGTAAIHLALLALGVAQGDEVICPTFTFAATVNPILYQQATPIFIDCENDTWGIDPVLLRKVVKEKVNSGKKPKAIIVMHNYGMPAKIEEIQQITQYFGIPLIEDAAAALGSKYKGKQVGTFGDLGVFSFNGNKIITTGGGGALVSNQQDLIDKARFFASQAKSPLPYYHWEKIGYNYTLSAILAAVGSAQIDLLEERIEKRRFIYDYYKAELQNIVGIQFQNEPEKSYSNRWLSNFLWQHDTKHSNITTEIIWENLRKENIESRFLWQPLHLQPAYQQYPYFGGQVAQNLFRTGLALPSGSNLQAWQLQQVIQIVKKSLYL